MNEPIPARAHVALEQRKLYQVIDTRTGQFVLARETASILAAQIIIELHNDACDAEHYRLVEVA